MRFRLAQALLFAALASAQPRPDWQAAKDLPDVDLAALTPAQKQTALKALRAQNCTCGCDMHVAECRIKDPSCGESRALAGIIVKAIREGKDPEKAIAESDL